MSTSEKLSVACKHCGQVNGFDQPYAIHAGFNHEGFLYNDSGTLTLVWSIFDPVFGSDRLLLPERRPWARSSVNCQYFEDRLLPAPDGSNWRFRNPARCIHCGKPISESILNSTFYLIYPGSIITNQGPQFQLKDYLKPAA